MGELWKIHLLGGLRVSRVAQMAAEGATGGESVPASIERFRTQKTAALLAYLAYYPQTHAREVLAEVLWPESEPQASSQSLRTSLSSLRRQLEPPGVLPGTVLIATRATIQLNPHAVSTDTREFQAACKEARAQTAQGSQKTTLLEQAVSLYSGPLLPGFYEEWVDGEARQLENEYFALLRELLSRLEAAGEHSRALHMAQMGARHDASQPELTRTLERLRRVLLLESEEDAPNIRASSAHRKKKAPVSSASRWSTPGASASDKSASKEDASGARDSEASTPERAFASRANRFAPIVLPAVLDRFFGRENEIARVRSELENGARLLTLTGVGGGGKTRLAIEAAHEFVKARRIEASNDQKSGNKKQRRESDKRGEIGCAEQGVFYVPLADLRAAHLITGAILEVLALPPTEPLLSRALSDTLPLDRLCAALSLRPTLLVLDNFEHLNADAAPLVQQLLSRVPDLQILVTSQQCLSIPGGREIPVSGLPFPVEESPQDSPAPADLESLLEYSSVQLFIDRAQSVAPDFQLTRHNAHAIGEICRILEGTPLALELAAARAGAFAPSQIASRLQNVQEKFAVLTSTRRPATPRHFSIHTAITWSFELLPPDLANLWAMLSVFRGGFTLEAAQTICDEPSAAHHLSQLRACSLVNVAERGGQLRFRLPELLREFAGEQLDSEARGVLQARHARFYNEILATYSSAQRTELEAELLAQALAETDNARYALDWTVQSGSDENTVLGAALALSLGTCLQRRGLHRESLEAVEAGLGAAQSLHQESEKANRKLTIALLREHAGLCLDLLEWDKAHASATQMLALCRKQKSFSGIAVATNLLGLVAKSRGRWSDARKHFSLAQTQFEKDRDLIGLANVRNNLGLIEYLDEGGDKSAAAEHLQETLRLRREIRDRRGVAEAHINLGALAQQSGEGANARRHYLAALAVEVQLQHVFGVGRALCNLGEIAEEDGQLERALRLYVAARTLFEETGVAYQQYTSQRMAHLSGETEISPEEIRIEARRLARAGMLEELAKWATEK